MTGFFRRWIPDGPGRLSVPWKLEAYSWGGRTVTWVALTWLLLAPFMMYNVAHSCSRRARPVMRRLSPARSRSCPGRTDGRRPAAAARAGRDGPVRQFGRDGSGQHGRPAGRRA